MRLVVYDRTQTRPGLAPGLSSIWRAGTRLYSLRGLADASLPAGSWSEAFDWLANVRPGERISEIQLWMHGLWGDARIGDDVFDRRSLVRGSERLAPLARIRARLAPGALFWFRTCQTFGAEKGQRFVSALAETLGCRIAGYTYIIGWWQSGLHVLAPGEKPTWPTNEGVAGGTPAAPTQALWSTPFEPRTITCLDGRLPAWA
jgi:hypothetical protein